MPTPYSEIDALLASYPDLTPLGADLQRACDLLIGCYRGGGKLLMVQPDAQGKFSLTCAPGEYFVTAFTAAQIKNLPGQLDDEYFKKDTQKFTRVKVRSAEKLKGLTIQVDFKN